MAIQCTKAIKGETDGWQALAEAIVVQAVKDYRAQERMKRRLLQKLRQANAMLSAADRSCLERRCRYYVAMQEAVVAFFLSEVFGTAYDLDGRDIITRLKKETGI